MCVALLLWVSFIRTFILMYSILSVYVCEQEEGKHCEPHDPFGLCLSAYLMATETGRKPEIERLECVFLVAKYIRICYCY